MSVIEVTSFKQLFNTLKENSMREEIIQEQRLRRVIREKLKQMLSQKNEQLLEEQGCVKLFVTNFLLKVMFLICTLTDLPVLMFSKMF